MTSKKSVAKTSNRNGISLIWVILTFLIVIGLGGLMLDWGHVYLVGHQLQNAADAAALAGSRYVAWDPNSATKIQARQKALEYAMSNNAAKTPVNLLLNTTNNAAGDIVIGRYISQTRTFIPTLSTPNAMKVVTRKDGTSNARLPLLFGRIFGFTERKLIQKYAIAKIYNATGAAVIALSDTEIGIYFHGNPEINIDNGGTVYSNTVNVSADFRGNPGTDVAEINLVGGYTVSGGYSPEDLTYDGLPSTLNTNVDPIEDPYANVPEPPLAAVSPTAPTDGSALKITGGTHVLQPGYYPGGLVVTGGEITLSPGIYQLGGATTGSTPKGGLDLNGGVIQANEVMFNIVGGTVNIRGNTQLTLTPPTSGTYTGISIFQKRGYDKDATINGGGGLDLMGVLYYPDNHVYVSGNGDTIGTRLVADTIEIAGTGAINIPYNGSPEISDKSYLVE